MKCDVTTDYEGPVISLEEAKVQGLKFFFTGKRCKHGHLSPRYIQRTCLYCQLIKAQKQRLDDPEKHKASAKEWRENNPDKVKENFAKWASENVDFLKEKEKIRYATNPEGERKRADIWLKANPERVKEGRKRRYRADPEKHREQKRNWVANNPEKAKAAKQRDYQNNIENYRKHRRIRRALAKNAEGNYTDSDVKSIMNSQGYKCYYCRQKLDLVSKPQPWHEDHLMPLSRGGSNWPENIVIACEGCNESKHKATHVEFLKSKRFERRLKAIASQYANI